MFSPFDELARWFEGALPMLRQNGALVALAFPERIAGDY